MFMKRKTYDKGFGDGKYRCNRNETTVNIRKKKTLLSLILFLLTHGGYFSR